MLPFLNICKVLDLVFQFQSFWIRTETCRSSPTPWMSMRASCQPISPAEKDPAMGSNCCRKQSHGVIWKVQLIEKAGLTNKKCLLTVAFPQLHPCQSQSSFTVLILLGCQRHHTAVGKEQEMQITIVWSISLDFVCLHVFVLLQLVHDQLLSCFTLHNLLFEEK